MDLGGPKHATSHASRTNEPAPGEAVVPSAASTAMSVGGPVGSEAEASSEDLLKEFSLNLRGAALNGTSPTWTLTNNIACGGCDAEHDALVSLISIVDGMVENKQLPKGLLPDGYRATKRAFDKCESNDEEYGMLLDLTSHFVDAINSGALKREQGQEGFDTLVQHIASYTKPADDDAAPSEDLLNEFLPDLCGVAPTVATGTVVVKNFDQNTGLPVPLTGAYAIALCDYRNIALVEAEETEIRGRWDWTDGYHGASACSFETKEEAALDAVKELGLESPFTREQWQIEAGQGNTQLGFADWVLHQEECFNFPCDAEARRVEIPNGISIPRCEKPTEPGLYFMGWTESDPSPRLQEFKMENGILTGYLHMPISDYGPHVWWGPIDFSREEELYEVTREQESLEVVPKKSVQRTLPYNEGSFKFECKHQSSAEDLHAAVGGYLLQQNGQFLVCSTDVAKTLRTKKQLTALKDNDFSELVASVVPNGLESDASIVRIEDLEPIPNKHLPKDFKDAVHLLIRPYIKISEAQYQQVMEMTEDPLTDIVRLKDGRQATFGEADGGFALMPLAKPI